MIRRSLFRPTMPIALLVFPLSVGLSAAIPLPVAITFAAELQPMRPLPVATPRPLPSTPLYVVDPQRGDDAQPGSPAQPWKSLTLALRKLRPGDTLCLRGGVYPTRPVLSRSGTAEAPITIRSYPGEIAIIDGGLPEFREHPESAWIPLQGGAPGEYVSTRTYEQYDDRRTPHQFLPGCWEPMLGKEDERPLAVGHFADSMVPLHSYRIAIDLRAENELWLGNKNEMRDTGIYGGPGLWYNRETGRIHIRLAHHQLDSLGDQAYRGETDPRKVPLIIAVGFGDDVCRINGVQHVHLQDLVFRGATGSPMVHIYGAEHIRLDHCSIYGGFPALLLNASQQVQITNCAFRGLAAPWTSRAHMKYRGTASYQIVTLNNQPRNSDIEISGCEFTDDHDFAYLRHVNQLKFHHNYVDNFNDDGLELGPKLRDHSMEIYLNHFGRILIPLTQHEIEKDESPLDHDANSGASFFRNVVDMRGGTYSTPPQSPAAIQEPLQREGHLLGDHGSPIYPVLRVYHNTFVRDTPVFRDGYLFGLASQGLKSTERDIFNNIFLQTDRVPGVGFVAVREPGQIREGGNILWGMKQGPELTMDWFQKFRSSPLFLASQQHYDAGWTTHDQVVDPQLRAVDADSSGRCDFRLLPNSPAVNAGQQLPESWPDPLRDQDPELPDIGVLPLNAADIRIGIDGRRSIFDR